MIPESQMQLFLTIEERINGLEDRIKSLEYLQQKQVKESGEDAFKEWLKATHPELYYTEENTQRGVDMREAWAAWAACEARYKNNGK